ncbi:MlaA family lipoprotein [Anianabacter salinae]|uniref:MlaA family lipoprotein n=1 Tax=Anianabacter salinae TaxID=2851023 RepID=UPI00225E1246|nr:VacJ family lipoprotein [Anianabacter salinae]MBV0913291.1 VacJ family lipoprotein [Anianabacter salinae]
MTTMLRPLAVVLIAAIGLSACARGPGAGMSDPYEAQNRGVFEENLRLDRAIVGPAARGYGGSLPDPVERGISNFAANAALPSDIVNDLLQANLDDAVVNVTRLLFNTTIGIGGIFDPMGATGLDARPSDFGETLHVWGAGEGNYIVLPILGPSTERDAVGIFVDAFTNPLSYVLGSPERFIPVPANIGSALSQRNAADATFDALILDAADPYAQARLLYLESRRFQLGGQGRSSDPYADGGGFDPYAPAAGGAPDPYEDPYAQ